MGFINQLITGGAPSCMCIAIAFPACDPKKSQKPSGAEVLIADGY